jgi:diguanylate cyclase (GGDEF)-like protein/PAS domain S-box-containing protein
VERRVHVLIVQHDPESRGALADALRAAGHRPEAVATAAAALATLARPTVPDLVLVEERMQDMQALDFLQAALRMARSAPVVVLGQDEAAALWIEATRLGAIDFVVADAEGDYLRTLGSRLAALRERTAQRDVAHRLADALESTAAAVLIADPAGRVETMNASCARLLGAGEGQRSLDDLFPLDHDPRLKSDLLAAVKVGGEWAGELEVRGGQGEVVPCIVTLSPIRRSGGRIDGLVLTLRDVSDRVAMEDALRAANRRLAEQASRDALTGIYNRTYFRDVLSRELARALRYGDGLAVLMIDLDRFKQINDEHGHAVGDQALCVVANALKATLRDADVLARYAGDEFCVLLPNTNRDRASAVSERLRTAVEALVLEEAADAPLRISLGVATAEDAVGQAGKPADALLRLADEALFASKRRGGNCVTVFEPRDAHAAAAP